MRGVFICGALVACSHPVVPKVGKVEAPPDAPVRIVFGDCTTGDTAFVSGPWSMEFTDAAPLPSESSLEGGSFASLTGTGDISSGFDDSNIYAGTGSGGTGWGTIGTGRYGTIGHTSTGGMRGRTPGAPSVSIGVPATNGDLDKAIIRRYIKRNVQKLEYCYEKQLLAKPGIAGTVQVQFLITSNGTVSRSDATGVDPDVASCVADVIRNVEFPKPKDGGGVSVNYPFTFDPGDSAPPPPPPPMFHPVVPEPAIVPGLASPLRARSDAFVACAGRDARAFVVGLTFGDNDEASVELAGANPDLAACFHAIVITRIKGQPKQLRCGLAFGLRPLTAMPAIAITARDVTYGATTVDRVGDIVTDSDLIHDRSPKLFEALDAWAQHEPIGPTNVAIRGVGLIEPIDTTPLKVIYRVLHSALLADVDYVLASRVGATWTPLREVVVPVAPVPSGTGRSWSGQAKTREVVSPRPELTVRITPDLISVITVDPTPGTEARVELEGRNWKKLEAALAERKHSRLFEARADVKLVGDDAVTYGDLVHVIAIAGKVGFVEWRVIQP